MEPETETEGWPRETGSPGRERATGEIFAEGAPPAGNRKARVASSHPARHLGSPQEDIKGDYGFGISTDEFWGVQPASRRETTWKSTPSRIS